MKSDVCDLMKDRGRGLPGDHLFCVKLHLQCDLNVFYCGVLTPEMSLWGHISEWPPTLPAAGATGPWNCSRRSRNAKTVNDKRFQFLKVFLVFRCPSERMEVWCDLKSGLWRTFGDFLWIQLTTVWFTFPTNTDVCFFSYTHSTEFPTFSEHSALLRTDLSW